MATVMKKVKRAGKRASKYQYTANFQSIVVECLKEKWLPHDLSVAWSRRGRRHFTSSRPWKASPDNRTRGVVVWPEVEEIEVTVTLYKGQKDKKFETKEWEFTVIDIDESGKRKILASCTINMAKYVMGLDKDLLLKLKPVSKKIKIVTLEVNLQCMFIKEGKATDDDMQSIASNMSYSKLSVIGILEDGSMDSRSRGGSFQEESGSRPVTPVIPAAIIESQDELIKWAKRMTVGYQGVKIYNMTTSWRNGLAFLAIIHHFKPNMVDFDALSPMNVKENNHLTCLLARELGISCTIKPDHMINATVPDKLAIASFVYQLHSYFNENIPSAVTPVVNNNIPALPGNNMADFDKITMSKLNSDSSVIGSPAEQPKSLSSGGLRKYSRHRLDDVNDLSTVDFTVKDATASNDAVTELFPIVQAPISNGINEGEEVSATEESVDDMFPRVGGSSAVKEADVPNGNTANDVPNFVVNSPTDDSVLFRIHAKPVEQKITVEEMAEDVVVVRRNSDSKLVVPEPPSNDPSTEDEGVVINLDVTVNEVKQSKQHEKRKRKLPSLPNLNPNSEQSKAVLQQRAQKMIKQASEGTIPLMNEDDARQTELKQRVKQILSSGQSESASAINKRIVKTGGVRVVGKAAPKPKIHVVQNATVVQPQEHLPVNSEESVNPDSSPTSERSDHNFSGNVQESACTEDTHKTSDDAEICKNDDNEAVEYDSSNVRKTAEPKQQPRKKRHYIRPEAKPIPKAPSALALTMASKPPAEKPNPIPETVCTPKTIATKNTDPMMNVDGDNDDTSAILNGAHDEVYTPPRSGTQSPDSLQSPSAWSSHSTDLAESILCSRSEFVVAELTQMQSRLRELDDKAGLIELDLRNAMDQGNKEREERLMKEWFQLLSEKNDIVRRQVELNLIEKEEDVERKEYLLRKELRALSTISDDIKTRDQKNKEAKLLQELLKTVEERNSIEQRKATTQEQKQSEAIGFAKAKLRSSDLARNKPASNNNPNNNCVVS